MPPKPKLRPTKIQPSAAAEKCTYCLYWFIILFHVLFGTYWTYIGPTSANSLANLPTVFIDPFL
jgi:hypothetical protein